MVAALMATFSGFSVTLASSKSHELHHDERLTILLPDLMDGADVRMVQCRGSTCLSAEPFECLCVMGNIFGQEFERDEATKLGILSLVDDTHATAAELFDDAVMRDPLSDHGWRRTQQAMLGMQQG
jgi:hypothetical protein